MLDFRQLAMFSGYIIHSWGFVNRKKKWFFVKFGDPLTGI